MAIVKGKSNLIHDRLDDTSMQEDPVVARGRLIAAHGNVANLATDNNTSMYKLADLPSDCIMDENTFFDVENWGFAQVVIGTKSDTDALVDQTLATENIVTPFAQGDANHGKRFWEVLGLAADPRGMIGIYAHAEADATGAGTMPFRLNYYYH